ncbi:MAG: MnhB domain-containing protein [Devosia sp.]
MNTLIFRTIGPFLVAIMLVFSVFVTLRGHNEQGGGFIGGLIAASAIAIYGMSSGVATVRRALRVNPIAIAGAGAALSGLAGFASLAFEAPFMTGLWAIAEIGGYEINVSSPMVFDIGVYLVVLGTISAVALALEDDGEED